MARPKKGEPKKAVGDRHKSGFMVRLPEGYRAVLDELRAKMRRPITTEVQVAIDAHALANGVKPPHNSPH